MECAEKANQERYGDRRNVEFVCWYLGWFTTREDKYWGRVR